MKKNKSGFTLVEIMVAVALLGGLSLVVMNLTKQSSKSSVKLQFDTDVTLTTNEISAILSDSVKCLAVLGTTTSPTNIMGKFYISSDPQAPSNGYGNSGLKITSYILTGTAPDGVLIINYQNKNILKGTQGIANVSKKINLYIEGIPGAITRCGAVSIATSDIWLRGSGSDIYYNTGNVGIGTITPTATLDVTGGIKSSGLIETTSGGVKFPNGTTQTSAVVSKNCQVGQFVSGIDPITGEITCSSAPQLNQQCADGQYVQGISSTGTLICSTKVISTNTGVVNCNGYWGSCSVTCGGGTQNFIVTTPPANGGAACPSNMPCNTQTCQNPVNCAGTWGACTGTCGGLGSKKFTITTAPANGGTACPYSPAVCQMGACSVCFPGNTLVLVMDEKRRRKRKKKISEIEEGDIVFDKDLNPTKVLKVKKHKRNQELFDVSGIFTTTLEHFIMTTDGWCSMKPGISYVEVALADNTIIYFSELSAELISTYGEENIKVKRTKKLEVGCFLQLADSQTIEVKYITPAKTTEEDDYVYTLYTESGSFVLANGVIADGINIDEIDYRALGFDMNFTEFVLNSLS